MEVLCFFTINNVDELKYILKYIKAPSRSFYFIKCNICGSFHYFTINDMRELSDNFTYGDSNIDDSSDDKVSVNIEWYE